VTARGSILLLLALLACHKTTPSAAKPDSSPMPAPEALVAEVSARGPDALWGRLQQGVGGPLVHLPQSLGGALVSIAKIDPTLAGEIDGTAPAYAVVAHPGSTFGWVVALRLRDVEHAKVALLGGAHPHFAARAGDGGLTVLGPPGDARASDPSYLVALSPLGYVVAARSEADLVTLAPYATRTLPARPLAGHAVVVTVPHAALAGPLREQLTAGIAEIRGAAAMLDSSLRTQHGGRAPDFGDPAAIIERVDDYAHQKLALLADVDHVEVTLDASDDDVTIEAVMAPAAARLTKALASIATGDASPLMTLSATTQGALLLRDDRASLDEGAKVAEESVAAIFKPTLAPKDLAPIHEALTAWAGARGSWLTLALNLDDGAAVTLRTPTDDPERAMKSIDRITTLTDLPAFHALLDARFSVEGVSTATVTAGEGSATSIKSFRHKGGADGPEVAIAWACTGPLLRVAAAGSTAAALRASKDPQKLLGADVPLAGKLGTLRDRSSIVFVARRNLDGRPDQQRANLVLGLGRDKANGWAMLEVDDAWLREGIGRWLDL